jgi:AraC family L-rhamnose operon transcriptional activator RhaR
MAKQRKKISTSNSRADRPTSALTRRYERLNDLSQLPLTVRLGSYRAEFMYWGVLGGKWWRNHLHTHSFFEICYAYSGRGTFGIFDESHTVGAGDLFIAKPGELHEIVSSRSHPLGICFWAYTLVPVAGQQMSEADHSIDALMHAFSATRRCVCPGRTRTDAILQLLAQEIADQLPGYTRAISGLAGKLLLDTARAATDGALQSEQLESLPHNEIEAMVQIASRYLRDNLSRRVSVRDVAAQVHLSERHISRLFNRVMGVSILDYLTRARLETASQLLLDREMSVKQVARAVGYPDAHYFSTLFGRKTGLTPGEFRTTGGTRFQRNKPV